MHAHEFCLRINRPSPYQHMADRLIPAVQRQGCTGQQASKKKPPQEKLRYPHLSSQSVDFRLPRLGPPLFKERLISLQSVQPFLSEIAAPVPSFYPFCCITLDHEGRIHTISQHSATLLGTEAQCLIGKSIYEFVTKKSVPVLSTFLCKALSGEAPATVEVQLRTAPNKQRRVRIDAFEPCQQGICRLIAFDVTEHRMLEHKIAAHIEQLKKMLSLQDIALQHVRFAMDFAPVGVLCIEKNGSIRYFNAGACSLFGFSLKDFSALCVFDLFPSYTPNTWIRYWNRLKHQRQAIYLYPFTRPCGTAAMLEFQCVFFLLDGCEAVYTFVRDVTEYINAQSELKKRAEELHHSQEQLRQLSARVIKAQDAERQRLARELHDDLGQSLALLKVQLVSLKRNMNSLNAALHTECKKIADYVDEIIENIRRMSRDLSPGVLEDLGITEALRILFRDFARHNKLVVTQSITKIDRLLDVDAQINLYRFCQEVLTNIHKHAHAHSFSASLTCRKGVVMLKIADDGVGFDANRVALESKHRGMGLTTLRERACMLKGTYSIYSTPGNGTCVSLRFPVGAVT